MLDRDSPTNHTPFTETEFASLQALRARHERAQTFTERELARLRFLRWLVRQPGWLRTRSQPRDFGSVGGGVAEEPPMDAWIFDLKAAHDGGYYKTEAVEGQQTVFPWANKTCKDCPFWSNGICEVRAEYRWSTAHTCRYFDPWNRLRAQDLIQARRWQGFRRWWEWFNDRGAVH